MSLELLKKWHLEPGKLISYVSFQLNIFSETLSLKMGIELAFIGKKLKFRKCIVLFFSCYLGELT